MSQYDSLGDRWSAIWQICQVSIVGVAIAMVFAMLRRWSGTGKRAGASQRLHNSRTALREAERTDGQLESDAPLSDRA
jgi:hypothetical protein